MYMARNVALSEKAYAVLKSVKKGKDSFSDVVLRLYDKENKKSILRYAGIWKDKKEVDRVFKRILRERHKTMYRERVKGW